MENPRTEVERVSRLLDRPTNAERKRRDLRERRSGVADAAASAPDQARWAEAGAVLAAQKKAAAKVSAAEDERFWAEVKKRLAEVEQRRRVRDTFSPDEVRALAQAAGARDLLAKIEAEARERDAAKAGAGTVQSDQAAQARVRIPAGQADQAQERQRATLEAVALEQFARRGKEAARTNDAAAQRFVAQQPATAAAEAKPAAAAASITQPARARPGAGLRRLFVPLAYAAAVFALGLGAGALWLQPAAQDGVAASRAPAAAQRETSAAQPLGLRIDADAAGFAARAAAPGPAPRRMQPRN